MVAKSIHIEARTVIGGDSRPFRRGPAMDRKYFFESWVHSFRREAAIVSREIGTYGGKRGLEVERGENVSRRWFEFSMIISLS